MLRKMSYSWAILLTVICLLAGCAGAGDWEVHFPNSYALWRVNSQEIIFGLEDGPSLEPIVEPYVHSYAQEGDYVFLRCSDPPETGMSRPEPDRWYLFDCSEGELNGPYYSEEGFLEACTEAGATAPEEWTKTVPAPSDALFD